MNGKVVTIATFVGFTNRGAEALLRTRIAAIRKYAPGTRFNVLTIYTDSCQPLEGVTYLQTFGGQREKLRSVPYLVSSLLQALIWTCEAVRYRLTGTCAKPEIRALGASDVFVSTDGDVLGEDYGLLPYIWRLYYLGLGLLLGKPVVIYAEGLGPFYSRPAKLLSKPFFERCRYLSVREKLSYRYMREIGIIKDIDIVADSAFLLEPEFPLKPIVHRKHKRLIGVAVSKLATQYGFRYGDETDPYMAFVKYMASIIDWMVVDLDADVILIPHVVQIKRDDYETAHDILAQVKNKTAVSVISKATNAPQLKGIIAGCDLLVASRMHAIIAGVSSGIPVVGIAYSHKARGLFDVLELDTVVDIKQLDLTLKDLIVSTLKSSGDIKNTLRPKVRMMRELADRPAQHVGDILSNAV